MHDPISDPREQPVTGRRTFAPAMAVNTMPTHLRGTTPDLRLALIRGGWMLTDVTHLTGIPTARLAALGCDALPTQAEIATLSIICPAWRPVIVLR